MGPALSQTLLWFLTAPMKTAQLPTSAIAHSFVHSSPLLSTDRVPGPVLSDAGAMAWIKADVVPALTEPRWPLTEK